VFFFSEEGVVWNGVPVKGVLMASGSDVASGNKLN